MSVFSSTTVEILGWVPAAILPVATLVQLVKIISHKRAEGVSTIAWLCFGTANLCLFGYTEKYTELQAILGLVGQATVDFSVAIAAFYYNRNTHRLEDMI